MIDVLHEHVEGLCMAVDLRIELEVGGEGELDTEHGARDGLHVRLQLEARELMDEPVDHLAHFRKAHELADLLRLEIIESLPRKVFLLNLPDDVLRDALELAKRRLREPHAPIDHLAEVEHAIREGGPSALEHDLVQAAHQARSRLRHVHHIGEEGEALELELRDVRLQKDVRLRSGLVHVLFDRYRHALDQARKLLLLLLAHGDVRKVGREREEAEKLNVAQCRLEILVVHRDRLVGHVVVRRHAPQVRWLQLTALALVAQQPAPDERGTRT